MVTEERVNLMSASAGRRKVRFAGLSGMICILKATMLDQSSQLRRMRVTIPFSAARLSITGVHLCAD
jgi:hypothetical protein